MRIWSFVIAELSRLFAVFLLQTSLGLLPISSRQTGGVSRLALAELMRAGREHAAHRSPTVGPQGTRAGTDWELHTALNPLVQEQSSAGSC